MPVVMLDAVEFSKIPSLQFVVPVVSADPTGYEAGFIYNSTTKEVKFHNGTAWIALGPAGAGGPPSGAAGGDLSGSYPNPQIATGVIVDADINGSAAIAQSKISGLAASFSAKQDTSAKGVANGYAPLDASNLIPTVHLPPLAINDVFTAASEAAMLALTAQVGDMCIRTDVNKTFVLSASPASTLANWKEVMAAGQVTSVNSQTGVVTITLASLGGAGFFAGDVPAGTACVVTHNLNSFDVGVTVFLNSGNRDTVMCDVERTTVNTVTLRFASAVTAGQYRCVVTGR